MANPSINQVQIDGIVYDIEAYTGTTDFNELDNRPKYNGQLMTGNTNVPEVKTAAWDAKQDALTPGDNISIKNGIIAATDTTYAPGTGISIDGNIISNTQTPGTEVSGTSDGYN